MLKKFGLLSVALLFCMFLAGAAAADKPATGGIMDMADEFPSPEFRRVLADL